LNGTGGELNIGPLRFPLRPEPDGPVRYSAPAYSGFFQAASSPGNCPAETGTANRDHPAEAGVVNGEPLIELAVDIRSGGCAPPSGEPLWRAGGHWGVWENGTNLLFGVGLQAPPAARRLCRAAHDLSQAELVIDPAAGPEAVLDSPLRYPLDQILSWGLLSKIGGVLLHAAAVVKDGTAWVLTGRSGAGKSTLAGLCHEQGWRILNDDRVMVFRRDGEWRVAGTPWHGSGRFAEAAEVPLGGVALLAQAPNNRIEPLSGSPARLALLDTAAVPWFEENWAQGTLDGLDRLVREMKPVRLHFTKTTESVRVLTGEAVPG